MASTDENVLSFMYSYQRQYGRPPVLQEIVDSVDGLNYRSSVRYVLEKLVKEGAVIELRDKRLRMRYAVRMT